MEYKKLMEAIERQTPPQDGSPLYRNTLEGGLGRLGIRDRLEAWWEKGERKEEVFKILKKETRPFVLPQWGEISPLKNVWAYGTYKWKGKEETWEALKGGVLPKFIDTAETYGFGRVENRLSEIYKRETFPIIPIYTKIAKNHLSSNSIKNFFLRQEALWPEKVPIRIQLHWPLLPFSISEVLEKIIEEAERRDWSVGVCNMSLVQILNLPEAIRSKIKSIQLRFNIQESKKRELFPYFWGLGVTVLAYSPLGQGLLLKQNGSKDLLQFVGKSRAVPIVGSNNVYHIKRNSNYLMEE